MLKIELIPTKRFEIIHGIQFRVYTGRTDTSVTLEMLGLFRVADPLKREEFERAVCAVSPSDPKPVQLLSEHGLVGP